MKGRNMIYDFACKIKNVAKQDILNDDALSELLGKINEQYEKPIEVRFVLPDFDQSGEVLVKGQISVSFMAQMHDKELEVAIDAFKSYLEALAKALEGEVSEKDGFFNNSKTFRKLYTI
jgi:hypothetical protein